MSDHDRFSSSPSRAGIFVPAILGFIAAWLLFSQQSGLRPASPREVAPRGDLMPEEERVIQTFEEASPSVVFITTKARARGPFRFSVREVDRGSGSGFVWDKQGHVVTNYHVIAPGDKFEVTFADHTSYDAEVVGVGPDKDLAVLKVSKPSTELHPLPVGTTKDLRVGQKVLAIGNPFGWDQTLTTGVVSALNRTITSINDRKIHDVIQTDAAINPGNSGGPLLDSSGRLIGVNTQIYSPSGANSGIGFAVPVDIVNWAVPQMIQHGGLIKPGLGIRLFSEYQNADLIRRLGMRGGVVVGEVHRDTPAEKAGLQGMRRTPRGLAFDIIVKIDDKPIPTVSALQDTLDQYKVGDEVEVTWKRGRETMEAKVTLRQIN